MEFTQNSRDTWPDSVPTADARLVLVVREDEDGMAETTFMSQLDPVLVVQLLREAIQKFTAIALSEQMGRN